MNSPDQVGEDSVDSLVTQLNLDYSGVIAALGGALMFTVFAMNVSALQRVAYFLSGWIGGYFFAAEALHRKWSDSLPFAAFLGGVLCVALCLSLLEAVQTGKPPLWLRYLLDRVLGRRRDRDDDDDKKGPTNAQ